MDTFPTNGVAPSPDADLRHRVRVVLTAADPEGLIALGAPDDEYGPQVGELARRLSSGPITAADVLDVWAARFGTDTWLAEHPRELEQLVRALNRARED